MSEVEALIQHHIAAFQRGDVEAVLSDYAPDAVMVTKGTGALVGVEAIRSAYEMIFEHVFPPATTTVDFEPLIAAGEIALLHFTARTPTVRTVGAFDSFVIRNGKIVGQTGGGEFVAVDS